MHWPLTSLSLTQSVDSVSIMFICMFDRASLGLCPSTVYACMNEDWTLLHTMQVENRKGTPNTTLQTTINTGILA